MGAIRRSILLVSAGHELPMAGDARKKELFDVSSPPEQPLDVGEPEFHEGRSRFVERTMSEPAAKQIVLASRPKGLPTRENFRVEEAPMPKLPQGGLLLRVLYLSLDPYMRGRMDDRKSYAKPVGLGEVMTAESVCEVIASDQAGYDVGDIVLAQTGWRTHATSAGAALRQLNPAPAPVTPRPWRLGMPRVTRH